jgi:hypothetical protein
LGACAFFGALIAIAAACSSGYSSAASGTEGGPCYANGTCNAGLTCASNLCVVIDAGTSSADGSATPDATGVSDVSSNDVDASDGVPNDAGPRCALLDGTYKVVIHGMDLIDAGGCGDTDYTFTWPPESGDFFGSGCMPSADGCTVTCDTTTPKSGTTTKVHLVFQLSDDGKGYTTTETWVRTDDQSGAVLVDCYYQGVASRE